MTNRRPGKRPLWQLAREQSIQDQPHRKYVRLELWPTHCLFGRDVVDGPGPGCLERAQAEFGKAEVCKFELIVCEQDEVFGFDIAVNDPVFMSMCERSKRLAREVECARGRDAPLQAVSERLLPQLHCNHEMVVDITGIKYGQNIRVLKFRSDPYFVEKLLFTGVVTRFRNLECHVSLVNRVEGMINIGQRTRRDASQDPVLVNLLSGP